MKNKHEFFSAILLAAMLLTACANDDGGNVGDASSTTDVSQTEIEAVETEYLAQYDGTDYDGEVYTIRVQSSDSYPNYVGGEISGEKVNDTQYQRDQWIETNYNVDISYIANNSGVSLVEELTTMILADETNIDCVVSQLNSSLNNLVSSSYLADLNKIEGFETDSEWWSQNMNEEFTINDRLFVTTGPMIFSYYYAPRIIAYNLRLAENYGVGDLYSVVDSHKWTLDYMYDTMKDVKADLDGDGEFGENDLWGASVDEYSAAGFYISAGGTLLKVNENGEGEFQFNDEHNYDVMAKVASIIGNKDTTQNSEPLSGMTLNEVTGIQNKVYTFKNGNALYLGYGAQAIAIYLRDMEDDYGILPVPKYDEAQDEYITFASSWVPAYLAIPRNNQRGELNGVILNTMGYISKRDVQPIITDTLLKGKAARDENSLRMIDLIYADVKQDLTSSYDFGGSFILLRDFTIGKKTNFMSEWEKIRSAAQEQLDELLENFYSFE